jgi:hypothetical protein
VNDIGKIIEEAKAGLLPFESWERLAGESSSAYAAFCYFRDYGPGRNIRKAVEASFTENGESVEGEAALLVGKKYRMWRQWAAKFRWNKRAADYDSYLDGLKQAEMRKTIEEQGRVHRAITGKMLQVVSKKLDMMNPEELKDGTVTEWVETAIRAEREAAGLAVSGGKADGAAKQGEINFTPEFEGI